MKKGFTLTEMIAVIGIIALMAIMILPKLLNQVNEKRIELSDTTKKMIYSAAELYANENIASYPKIANSSYCIKISTLVDLGYLKKPLTDVKTGKDIDLTNLVKINVDEYNQYGQFDIVDNCDEIS